MPHPVFAGSHPIQMFRYVEDDPQILWQYTNYGWSYVDRVSSAEDLDNVGYALMKKGLQDSGSIATFIAEEMDLYFQLNSDDYPEHCNSWSQIVAIAAFFEGFVRSLGVYFAGSVGVRVLEEEAINQATVLFTIAPPGFYELTIEFNIHLGTQIFGPSFDLEGRLEREFGRMKPCRRPR